jgi:PAS domain S-box-containing protein
MNELVAAKHYGPPIALGGLALILGHELPNAAPFCLPLTLAATSLLVSSSLPVPSRGRSTHLAVSSAAFLVTLGMSVLVGWSFHIGTLIQLLPQLPPMMKNTAACFVLIGIALFLQEMRRLGWVVTICAGIVGVLGFLTFSEYVTGVNIGTDHILGPDTFEFKDSNPGRSAPASAVCFVLTSLSLLVATRSVNGRPTWTLGLIGSTVSAVGLATALEFSLGSSAAFGWANFTGMAVHTAVGFCALGLGLLALAWPPAGGRQGTPSWLPISVLIGVATGVVGVWQGLIAGGQAPFAPIPAIVILGGLAMAATFGLTVALAQWAYSRARQLRDSERQLRLLVETLPVEMWCATPEGQITYFNQRLARNVGLDHCNLEALNRMTNLHPEDMPEARRRWTHSVETGESYSSLLRSRRAGEGYSWRQVVAEPLRDEHGRILQWYGAQIDVDSQMTLEEALNAMRARLTHATQLATVAQLSAAIAHEVNQPLAAIAANAGACHRWLSAAPPNLERAQLTAERIVRDANAASDVVSRVRSLFKQSAPTATLLNFNEVIAEVRNLMLDEDSSRSVQIETNLQPDLPSILADRVQMQQVLVNLARNGIEAMGATQDMPKVLSIRSRRDGTSNIHVEVCDRGIGLQDTEKVFEPFFTTKGSGMGMGLAICRSIIEAHQGRLWATRNDDRGTTFRFTLPIIASDAQ